MDWHNSLEKEDQVQALEKLLEVADVHVLSYVASRGRMAQVHQDVRDMARAAQVQGGVAGQSSLLQMVESRGRL